jgi:hypothetical protein
MQSQLLFSVWEDLPTHFAHPFWIFHAQINASKGVTKYTLTMYFPSFHEVGNLSINLNIIYVVYIFSIMYIPCDPIQIS